MTTTVPDEEVPSSGVAVRRGFFWNLVNFVLGQGAGMVIFLLLSRQMSPAIFGVFAMSALLVDLFATQFRWAAMDALVQRQEFSRAALSSAFWTMMGAAAGLAVLFVLGARWAGAAYGEPEVANVLPLLGLTLLLVPPLAVMDALIMRTLRFRAQALRTIAGTLAGGAAGLSFAFSPAAEWALLAQRVASLGLSLVVMALFTRWRPSFLLERAHAHAFLARAGRLWVATLMSTLPTRLVEASVGARAGAAALGLFTAAQRFEQALHGPLTGPIQALWVPILSRLHAGGPERLELFTRLVQIASLTAMPAFVGLGLVGGEIVPLVLDPRYAGAAQVLLVLGMIGLVVPLGFYSNLIFAGLDRSDLSMRFSALSIAVQAPCIWFAAPFGPAAAAAASMAAGAGFGVAATALQTRMMGGRFLDLLRALSPAYQAVAAMMAGVILTGALAGEAPRLARLVLMIAVGAGIYAGWLALFHRAWAMEIVRFLTDLRAGRVQAVG